MEWSVVDTWEWYLVVDTAPEQAKTTTSSLPNITVKQQGENEWDGNPQCSLLTDGPPIGHFRTMNPPQHNLPAVFQIDNNWLSGDAKIEFSPRKKYLCWNIFNNFCNELSEKIIAKDNMAIGLMTICVALSLAYWKIGRNEQLFFLGATQNDPHPPYKRVEKGHSKMGSY